MTDVLSPEIRKFISRNIDSVAMLEILLFFRKRREKEWTVDEVALELRSSAPAVETRAQQLLKKGFLKTGSRGSSYQYEAPSEELGRLAEKLTKLYSQFQMRVIEQIYSPQRSAAQDP